MSATSPRLAKRPLPDGLHLPTWWSGPEVMFTSGPEVADLAALAGLPPDPEQQLVLDTLFAIGPDGLPLVFETDILAPRQVMKTGTIKQAKLGWLFVTREPRTVYSAHELDTAEGTFKDVAAMIESVPALSRRLAPTRGDRPGIVEQTGKWSITTAAGPYCRYKARTKAGSRGLTGNKTVVDEAFALTAAMVGAIWPTMAAVPSSQLLVASSAGKLESAELRRIRDRGRAGKDRDQAYFEWGDRSPGGCELGIRCSHKAGYVRGCALDDEERWARIITQLGRRITLRKMRSFRAGMPPEEFAREFLMWWDDPPLEDDEGPIDLEQWRQRRNDDAKKPRGQVVLSVDVNPNRTEAAIGVAGRGRGGRTLVMVKTAGGVDWVVKELKRLCRKHDVAELVLHPGGQAGHLLPEIEDADLGVDVHGLTLTELGQSCAAIQEAIKRDLIEHVGQPELDNAVAVARLATRGEAQIFDRIKHTDEICQLVAASEASWRYSLLDDYDVMDSV